MIGGVIIIGGGGGAGHGYRAAYKRGLRVAGELPRDGDPWGPRHPRRELLTFERVCHGQAGLADESPKPTA